MGTAQNNTWYPSIGHSVCPHVPDVVAQAGGGLEGYSKTRADTKLRGATMQAGSGIFSDIRD